MEQKTGGNLALKLSVEVLRRNISLDEGLVRAQTSGMVEPFVEGLNILVGRDLFDINEARQRLRSGAAERAVNGHDEPLQLPSELDGWTLDSEGKKPPLDERDFTTLEIQVNKILSEKQEILSRIDLLNAATQREDHIPNPWTAPLVILSLTVVAVSVFQFGVGSTLGSGISLAVGSLFTLVVFQKEMSRFEAVNRRIRSEIKKGMAIKKKCLDELRECDRRVATLRNRAAEMVEDCDPLPEEEMANFLEKFPGLFPTEEKAASE
ncbi:MAG: hypothetical protein KC917_02515 [Candidatus Omnitrophica bacterium]|nr:hypothetical protein [Candidatus Omnitrophota bacterium]